MTKKVEDAFDCDLDGQQGIGTASRALSLSPKSDMEGGDIKYYRVLHGDAERVDENGRQVSLNDQAY